MTSAPTSWGARPTSRWAAWAPWTGGPACSSAPNGAGWPSRRPGPSWTSAAWTTRPPCCGSTRLDKKIAGRTLAAQARPRRPAVHRLRGARAHLRRHGPPARLHPPLTLHAPPHLHVPGRTDGPGRGLAGRRGRRCATWATCWRPTAGLIDWLWSRWSSLGRAGMTRDDFAGDRPRTTDASCGSGWPASGRGPSAARGWWAGSTGAWRRSTPAR